MLDKKFNKKNKKSFVFTIVGIVLSAIVVLALAVKTEYTLKNKMEVIKIRIDTMNDFIIDVEEDLQRGLFIIGFNSLLAIENYITSNGTYIKDIDATFRTALLEGTINNSEVDSLRNNTFTDWTNRIKKQANKIGMDINFTISNLSLYHEEPWAVTVDLGVKLDARDKKGTSSWLISENIKTNIDITGLEDPVYTIETFGRVLNAVNKTPVSGFSNLDNLKLHINNSYYKESATAPDFLMRMEGNFSSSPYGIESIVNLNKLSAQGLQTYARSDIDYIYFANPAHSSCIILETLDTEFDWLRLDNGIEPLNHLNDYGLNCQE